MAAIQAVVERVAAAGDHRGVGRAVAPVDDGRERCFRSVLWVGEGAADAEIGARPLAGAGRDDRRRADGRGCRDGDRQREGLREVVAEPIVGGESDWIRAVGAEQRRAAKRAGAVPVVME